MKTGDKVVCVDDAPCFTCGIKMTGLFKDQLYVISHFDPDCRELVCMLGVEFVCECGNDGAAIERFRKLDELKAEARQRQSKPKTNYANKT